MSEGLAIMDCCISADGINLAVTVVGLKVGLWPRLSPGDTDEYYGESHIR